MRAYADLFSPPRGVRTGVSTWSRGARRWVLVLAWTMCLMGIAASSAGAAADVDLLTHGSLRVDGTHEVTVGNTEGSRLKGTAAGDINGDGRGDMILEDGDGGGEAYGYNYISDAAFVIYGQDRFGSIDLAHLDSKDGFRIIDSTIGGVSDPVGVGDVNGDGNADLAVGNGGVSVIFGGRNSGAEIDVAKLGNDGFQVNSTYCRQGIPFKHLDGGAGPGSGDVNGDGLDDIVLGESQNCGGGPDAYVVFGKRSTEPVSLGALGLGGFEIHSGHAFFSYGNIGARVSDMTGDGRAEVLVGGGSGTSDAPGGMVVFGKATTDPVYLSSLGIGGFVITQGVEDVADLGDVNGDRRSDFAVRKVHSAGESNPTYVIFGKNTGTPVDTDNLGAGGYRIDPNAGNVYNTRVEALGGAGDINRDGLADILVGVPSVSAGTGRYGVTNVLYGKADTSTISLDNIGSRGFRVLSAQWSAAYDVTSVGDATKDGTPDLLLSAPGASENGRLSSGSVYLVTEKATTDPVYTPRIIGLAKDGETLTASRPVSGDQTFRWLTCAGAADCKPIPGATDARLELTEVDIGERIAVEVTNEGLGTMRSSRSDIIAAAAPVKEARATISGRAVAGSVLTAVAHGVFAGSPAQLQYQWLRCGDLELEDVGCVEIAGETSSDYTVRAIDAGARLRVRARALNDAGTDTSLSRVSETVGGLLTPAEFAAPTRTVTPGTTAEDLAYAKEFRADHAMRNDDQYIAALDGDASLERSRQDYGLSLAPLERRDLMLRSLVAKATTTIASVASTNSPDTYAGYYIDKEGMVVVRFTAALDARVAEVRRVFPYPSRIRGELATYSAKTIKDLETAIDGDGPALEQEGIDIGSFEADFERNRLRVAVVGFTQAKADTIRSRYGGATTVEAFNEIELTAGRAARQTLRGGLRIFERRNSSGQDDCTSGFNGSIFNTYGGTRVRGMVTAGHCSNAYTTYTAGRPPLGGAHHHNSEQWVQSDREYGETNENTINSGRNEQDIRGKRSSDAVTINVNSDKDATNLIYAGPRRVRRVTEQARDDGDNGSEVIISRGQGADDRNYVGKVRSISYRENSARRPSVYNSRIVKGTKCQPGDSGSPVYRILKDGGAEAIGMVFARIKNTGECVYGHIRYIREETTFEVYTADSGGPGQG